MNVNCDRCFFSKENFCRVAPPDPMLERGFPEIWKDKHPCGEYLDRETGLNLEELIKRTRQKAQIRAMHPERTRNNA